MFLEFSWQDSNKNNLHTHDLDLVITGLVHDDVIKWKHFPCYRPFVRGIDRSPVNSPHKGQWRGALMFSLICAWINGWINNREAGDLRRHRIIHYDVTVIYLLVPISTRLWTGAALIFSFQRLIGQQSFRKTFCHPNAIFKWPLRSRDWARFNHVLFECLGFLQRVR